MPNTVRFARVVEACGQPQAHTLWVEPAKDRELHRAQEGHRVMTVHRARGKAEVGTIGFQPTAGKNEQYLIFPKSLRRFEGARVVGVKFDLIDQPKLAAVDTHAWIASRPTGSKKKPSLPAPITFPRTLSTVEMPAAHEGITAAPAPRRPPKVAKRTAAAPANEKPGKIPVPQPETALAREVRAALEELERGKTVAAYRRLERALDRQ